MISIQTPITTVKPATTASSSPDLNAVTNNTSQSSTFPETGSSQGLTNLLDQIYGKTGDLQGEIGSLGDLLGLLAKGDDLLAEITTNISRFINFVRTKASQSILSYTDLSAAEKKEAAEIVHGFIDPIYGSATGKYSTEMSLRTLTENNSASLPRLTNAEKTGKYDCIIEAFSKIKDINTPGSPGLDQILPAYATNTGYYSEAAPTQSDRMAYLLWNHVATTPEAESGLNSIVLSINSIGSYFNSQNTKIQLEVQEIVNRYNEILTFLKTAWQTLFGLAQKIMDRMSR